MTALINIDVPDFQAASAFYQTAVSLTQSGMLDEDVVDWAGFSS